MYLKIRYVLLMKGKKTKRMKVMMRKKTMNPKPKYNKKSKQTLKLMQMTMIKKRKMKRKFKQNQKLLLSHKLEANMEEIRMECSIIIATTLSYEIKSMSKKAATKICSIRLMKNFKTTVSSNKLSK